MFLFLLTLAIATTFTGSSDTIEKQEQGSIVITGNLDRIWEEELDLRFMRDAVDKGVWKDPVELMNRAATYCYRNGFEVPEVTMETPRERDCLVGMFKYLNRRLNNGRGAYAEYLETVVQEKQTVRIAVFEGTESRHSEVIGMILQHFKTHDIDVFLKLPFTSMSFLNVYLDMPERFGTFRVLDVAHFDDHVAQQYDIVFFNTAEQAWTTHVSDLSPVIDSSHYALPVLDLPMSSFLPPPRQGHDKFVDGWMRIAVIGFGNPGKSVEDVVSLVHEIYHEKLPVRVVIISKGKGMAEYLKHSLQPYMKMGFVSWIERCSTTQMLRIARLSRFIFTAIGDNSSCYRRLRLSGSIPLALSLGIPLIIDTSFASTYGISNEASVLYDKSDAMSDVLNRVMSQSSEEYISMRHSLLELASKHRSHSRRLLLQSA
eukprot:g3483.t1